MLLTRRMGRLCAFQIRCASKSIPAEVPDDKQTETPIIIPDRIHREPTDILMALSSTVNQDPTAAHFKYHDDPYLIPTCNVTKRTYAMAQESGRKAAGWIKNQHAELFNHQEAQPRIEAYAPKIVLNEESEINESFLKNLIPNSQVTDVGFAYKLMKSKGTPISEYLKQNLLEIICYYNNEEPIADEYIEERWFSQLQSKGQKKTWKDGDLAEQIFNEITPKTVAAYTAIIRGMAKFYQAERAYALFQEGSEKQMEFDTRTYNAIISIVSTLKESMEQRWGLCQELLQRMDQQTLKPDLGTLNAVLETISSFGNQKVAQEKALQILSTFKKVGIEPSLGTYYFMLNIFCRERGAVSHILVDILNEIEGKQFKVAHPKDTFFFVTAMDVCRNHLQDKAQAERVNALLNTGMNYDLIGDSYKEAIYYRHLFALLCRTTTLDEVMDYYNRLVPSIYIPEPGIMEELVKTIEYNGAIELLPHMWNDIVIFNHLNRESLLNRVLSVATSIRPCPEQNPTHIRLDQHYLKIAEDAYTKLISQGDNPRTTKRITITGQMMGDILTLAVRAGDFELATKVFNTIDNEQHKIVGTPTDTSLEEFVNLCVTNKAPTLAMNCIEYAVDNSMDSVGLATIIKNGFTLSDAHLVKFKRLMGDNALDNLV